MHVKLCPPGVTRYKCTVAPLIGGTAVSNELGLFCEEWGGRLDRYVGD